MKYKLIILLLVPTLLSSCFKDKGNYDYRHIEKFTIEGIPESIELLGNSDHIVIEPTVTSDVAGIIKDGDPNYTFDCKIEIKSGGILNSGGGRWVSINPQGRLKVDTLATFPENNYIGYYSVKENRTGVETIKKFEMKITSPTYEGWMVWCNEGPDNRARLDMISVISKDRIITAYDLLPSRGAPEMHNASRIGFAPNRTAADDSFYVLSESGSYKLNNTTLATDESWNIKAVDFVFGPDEEFVNYLSHHNFMNIRTPEAIFTISTAGNAYCLLPERSGAAFEDPINTSVRGGAPEFRVSPFMATGMGSPNFGNCALFYDIDNKRFVVWRFGTVVEGRHVLTPLANDQSEGKLFSYNTGMDMVYMEGTAYSQGLAYSILQDNAGKRHIYGINLGTYGGSIIQESLYENISAPDFDKATCFAFHSQFPFLFYSAGNKVYLYNLGTGAAKLMSNVNLAPTEEVTMLKFNLYRQAVWDLALPSPEFSSYQFNLMVGSYDTAAGDVNGGKLGFYTVDGTKENIEKRVEYTGFARIQDVLYRERR